jgi:hypothetical protein
MTANGYDSPDAPVTPATTTAWRRRREASREVAPLPHDDEKPRNGSHATNDAITLRSRDAAASFAASQQAGLSAIISIAYARPMPGPPPTVDPDEPRFEQPTSTPNPPTVPAIAGLAPIGVAPEPMTDRTETPERPVYVAPAHGPVVGAHSTRRRRAIWRNLNPARAPGLPLLIILTAQVVLSLRLVWSNTAFSDEALYLWAGHLEWEHWLHGTSIPPFPTYFSGAPVIYPPLGALANAIGGLAGARVLSLAFMLGTTVLLYVATSRLFNRKAGGCAAAIFVALGPVQVLSAFATYDAMAIFFIALATWLVIRAQGVGSEWFLIVSGLTLAVADATKYAAALWTPVVIILAALTETRRGWIRPTFRGARLAAYAIVPLTVALLGFGGKPYIRGLMVSTLNRQMGDTSALTILSDSLKWIGIAMVFALVGTVISFMVPGRLRWICITLTAAGLLAPLHQAQIHVFVSIHKHVAFGAWFVAIAAGYAFARAAEVNDTKGWRVAGVAAGLTLVLAIPQTTAMFYGWPDSFQMVENLAGAIKSAGCPCLIAEQTVVSYYLPWTRNDLLVGPYEFPYWSPVAHRGLHGIPAYTQAIRDHYFSVVEIDRAENPGIVKPVIQALTQTRGYYLADLIPIAHWGQSSIEIWRRGSR